MSLISLKAHLMIQIWRAIKFRILVSQYPFLAKTLLHKNASNSLNNGPILKIQIVPESWDLALQY